MTLQTPPGWLQNSGTINTAQQLRNYAGISLPGDSSLKPRGGVNLDVGGKLAVTENSPQAMNVLVASGACFVPGTENAMQGGYSVFNDGTVTVNLAASHATLNRIDLIVVRIKDAQYSGVDNTVTIEAVTGTPDASPVAPAAPFNSLILAQAFVGAAVTTISNSNITDRRTPLSNFLEVLKTADETVNNSTTFQDDDQLFVYLALPSSRWTVDCWVRCISTSVADIKFTWTAPTGAGMDWFDVFDHAAVTTPGSTITVNTSGSEQAVNLRGLISTSTTPGFLKLRWAQNTAEVSNTIVRARSWLQLQRVG